MPKPDHPPAFLFYPSDFSSDSKVEAMTTESVGAYMLLLCKAWREEPAGSLPDDDRILARWARLESDRWMEVKAQVLAPFDLGTDSRWHQKRMRLEFDRLMAKRKERAKSGKKGAKARWEYDEGGSANGSAIGSAIDLPMANDGISSSVSSSVSISNQTIGGAEKPPNEIENAFVRRLFDEVNWLIAAQINPNKRERLIGLITANGEEVSREVLESAPSKCTKSGIDVWLAWSITTLANRLAEKPNPKRSSIPKQATTRPSPNRKAVASE